MSTREIIAELARLTPAELQAVEKRIIELTSRRASASDRRLRTKRVAGRLLLSGAEVVRQAEVEAVLSEFP